MKERESPHVIWTKTIRLTYYKADMRICTIMAHEDSYGSDFSLSHSSPFTKSTPMLKQEALDQGFQCFCWLWK